MRLWSGNVKEMTVTVVFTELYKDYRSLKQAKENTSSDAAISGQNHAAATTQKVPRWTWQFLCY